MKLESYLASAGLSFQAMGDLIGCSAETVRRYANGAREPSFETIRKIHDVTGGQVGPDDFVFTAPSVEEPTP
jgi:transcriptional regulator with XRE-family HTH domain